MNFIDGYLVHDAHDMRNDADYYLGRTYKWGTGTVTRVIGWDAEAGRMKLAGRPGRPTIAEFKGWVRNGTLTAC